MKVICIQQPPSIAYVRGKQIKVPSDCMINVGEFYNVIDSRKGYKDVILYILSEKPSNWGYNPKYFTNTSDIDETELVNQRPEKQLQACGG